ncbi:Serpin B9 [Amphibalanus amphitrite]|uniref:Serpin B9 n=2 Tax=Amphibalanus amphitrite TaxID=1232801 RepID=A0A6A4WA11_AMPAM|nr:Serpin B9 [Amphibalanus amphitrite]
MAATAASRPRRQLAAQPRPPPPSTRAPPFSITQSILRFTSALGDRIGGGNVVISPFSIVSVLNLLLLGAADNTYEQLRQVLQYPFEVDDLLIHQQSGIQLQSLRRETRGVNVQIANRIFTDSAFAIDREFARQARDFYQAGVEQLQFGKHPAAAARRINLWVRDHTNGQIEKIFDSPPPRNTRMIGANVVYFNSSWQTPFDPADTKPLTFTLERGSQVCVPMMFAELTVPFVSYSREGFAAVALPYAGAEYAMVVLVPDEAGEQPLRKLEQQLAGGRLQRVFDDMRPANLSVWLPRFKMQFSLALRDILQEMGATDLFQESRASLGRLSSDRQLFLSEVLHQAVIDVHEAGTEASAVTTTLVNRDRLATTFRANRPFLFVIRDNKTGVPLFYGRMLSPEEGVPRPGRGQTCNGRNRRRPGATRF